MTKRDRREYHRSLRASAGYGERERIKEEARRLDPVYLEKEREKERLRSIKRRATDREKLNAQARLRHAEKMISDPEYKQSKSAHSLRWIKSNPAKALANVVRRDAQKLRAIPAWADKEQIKAIYQEAAVRRAAGFQCEVDHIVPLRSPYVCGLHVPANLQLLESQANKAKGNRHWPGK